MWKFRNGSCIKPVLYNSNSHINVSFPHFGNKALLTFGTTLNKQPCEASYGIDDVMIYIK